MCIHVHSSIAHINQAKCAPADQQRRTMRSTTQRMLFGFEEEGNSATCYTWMNLEDIMLSEISQTQWHVNHEIPDVQAGFRKGRGIKDQIANIH